MDVKKLLIDTLEEAFKLEVILQGSMPEEDKYPDSFFTFFNNETSSDEWYDNSESVTVWDFDLNFYSNDPATVNDMLLEAKRLLREKGFIIDGKGYDVLSDEPTHTGRGINIIYIEKEERR